MRTTEDIQKIIDEFNAVVETCPVNVNPQWRQDLEKVAMKINWTFTPRTGRIGKVA